MLATITLEDVKKSYGLYSLLESHSDYFTTGYMGKKEVTVSVDKEITNHLNAYFKKENSFLMVKCHNVIRDVGWDRCFMKDESGSFLYVITFQLLDDVLGFHFSKFGFQNERYLALNEDYPIMAFLEKTARIVLKQTLERNEYRLLYATGLLRIPEIYDN